MNAVSSSKNMPSPDRALSQTQNHNEDTLLQVPGREEMRAIFAMCRKNQWNSVLRCVQNNPMIPITIMIMDNHISTTILHQAITSKGNTVLRSRVIRKILDLAPQAATIKNGYGSLPLHVISQRNTKMDAPTKELLIGELVRSFQGALLQPGGVGKRTPLHIIFTDYISPRVTEMMIQNGPQACFMKDKKGYLPAHVACSRHCSPEKLRMLLHVHPESLLAKTNDGQTLLSLAIGMATRSHPNYALIDALRSQMDEMGLPKHDTTTTTTTTSSTTTSIRLCVAASRLEEKKETDPCIRLIGNKRSRNQRKVTDDAMDDNDPVNLLLHFSRHTDDRIQKVEQV